jgi:RNA polymerase sigma factor (sigma-70 family)
VPECPLRVFLWNCLSLIGKLVDVDSFEDVFESEFRPLCRYLRRRVGATEAEDLAEATFATAYSNWGRLDPARPVRPWLYGIAANLLRHHWRTERRRLRAYARTGIDPVLSPEDLAVERADGAFRFRALAGALARLRPQEREILLLHAWAQLTDAEIAEALRLPEGTVKSRLHRTRSKLRNQLQPSGQKPMNVMARPEE